MCFDIFVFLFLQGTDDPQQADENKPVNAKSKNDTNTSVQELASAKDTDSSEDESGEEDSDKDDSGDFEVATVHIISL